MARLVITIPDAQAQRVVLALSEAWGYSRRNRPGVPPPGGQQPPDETRAQFVKRVLQAQLRRVVIRQEALLAAEATRRATVEQSTAEIGLTVGD